MAITIQSAVEDIKRLLGMTDQQYTVLVPGGKYDREGFAGVVVTDESEMTYKQRLAERDRAEGWKRV